MNILFITIIAMSVSGVSVHSTSTVMASQDRCRDAMNYFNSTDYSASLERTKNHTSFKVSVVARCL